MDKKIEKLSLYISNFYQKKTNCLNEKKEELHFLLQYFIFNITVLSTIIIINSTFGLFKESILVLLTFMSLRSSSGGFHCDTYGKCYIVSNILILVVSILTYILIPYYIPCSIIASLSVLYIYKKYIPKPNEHDENLFMTKEEKKRKFFKTLVILIIIMTIGAIFEFKLLVTGVSMSMLSVSLLTSDTGEYCFRKLQNYI